MYELLILMMYFSVVVQAFGMDAEDSPYKHEYVWKLSVVVGGIYMFFLVERLLQIFLGKDTLYVS